MFQQAIAGCVLAALASCGGGGGGAGPPEPEPQTVTARIAQFPGSRKGIPVRLDASSSSTTSGAPLTFHWRLPRTPKRSEARIDADGAFAEFTPDLTGYYWVVLTVSDGLSSDRLEVMILVEGNKAPHIRVNDEKFAALDDAPHVLDASASFDAERYLFFEWSVTGMPPGAVVEPATGTDDVFSFTSTLPGTYEVTLFTDDGASEKTFVFRAGRYQTTAEFEIGMTAFDHHADTGILVAIDEATAEAHVIDLVNDTVATVALPAPPLSVAIAPAGDFVAIGHESAVTELALAPGHAIVSHAVAFRAEQVAHGGNGYVYAAQTGSAIASIEIATGVVDSPTYPAASYAETMRMHPDKPWLYAGDHGQTITKLDVGAGNASELYLNYFSICARRLWFLGDGTQLLGECGAVATSRATEEDDLVRLGEFDLADDDTIVALGESSDFRTLAAVTERRFEPDRPRTLRWFDTESFATLDSDRLPAGPDGVALVPFAAGYRPGGATATFVLTAPDASGTVRLLTR